MDPIGFALERLRELNSQVLVKVGNDVLTVGTLSFIAITFLLLWFFAKKFEQWLFAKLTNAAVLNESGRKKLVGIVFSMLVLAGTISILDLSDLNITALQIIGYLNRFLNFSIIHIGNTQITFGTIIYVLSLWLLLVLATNRLQQWFVDSLLSKTGIDSGTSNAAAVIFKYLVVSLGFIVILQSAGVDLSALTVVAGALGLGLSFGLQNITSNLVSGLIVLIERPIKVGDRIEVAGLTGDVMKIALRATTIRTNDNIEIIVPNSQFISGNVVNWSLSSRSVRVSIPVGVSYDSDPELVRDILLRVAEKHSGVLTEPVPSVVFKGFGDSSLDFVLRVFTLSHTTTPLMLQSELNFSIFKEFKANKIEIPFPQRDIHIRSVVEQGLIGAK